ncbi:hypothetical protein LK994_09955 [Ferruginibacter lapsinanis]|uniref:hypothetical protein n=1 Tax=Ferruginibacter lapsinanis TaxID=563172 RepID=UPI001E4646B8|nr:hypothetical protein [Ferruginibacter lapsinanis]UEG48959.1 hypothetical protein LK994_09955 [Ferruginibacter lapsinanis]
MELFDFEHNFGIYYPPQELISLLDFQNKYYKYSNGFGLFAEGRFPIQYLSKEEGFLNQLMPFADGSPIAVYSLWDDGTDRKLNTMPVVVFGDEGGVHVVAEDIFSLMQLLTFDTPISVDIDKVFFYKDTNTYEKSLHHELYKSWLKENFQLESINDTTKIIKTAQEKYKEQFDCWCGKYLR